MNADDFSDNILSFDRTVEFPQLKDSVYLDHAGATLYSKSQIEAHHRELLSNLYGNPHSRSQSSRLTTDAIDQIRFRILQFFNTTSEEYTVIFTSGCTGGLKLVAEAFTFDEKSCCHGDKWGNNLETERSQNHFENHGECCDNEQNSDCCIENHQYDTVKQKCYLQLTAGCFVYLMDNHTSAQGMREVLKDKVQAIICVEQLAEELDFKLHYLLRRLDDTHDGNCLFVFPGQSNFCGHKYPMEWINKTHHHQMTFQSSFPGRWFVLLDAASYVSTSHLDLAVNKPDFVTLSFYKMFGFPTGIGALLVKNESAGVLNKVYFGGGTVGVSSPIELFHINHASLSDRFEDGTVQFLDIIALRHGFNTLENLGGGIRSISLHTFILAQYFHHCLQNIRHGNCMPVAVIYCHGDFSDPSTQGPIVNFNLKRQDGTYIGFSEVDKMAQLYNIHIRTGCFCNIGACQKYLGLSSQQIKQNFEAGHVCGDDKDLIDGIPTGSVRVSFGYMSTIDDAQHCLKFICECFLENDKKPDFSVEKYSQNLKSKVFCDKNSVIRNDCYNKSDWSDSNTVIKDCNKKYDWSDSNSVIKDCKMKSGWIKSGIISYDTSHMTDVTASALYRCSLNNRVVTNICLYPVKSCGAFEVSEWEICETGLKYDREWMIVSESGVTVSQKREPRLCLIKPKIDLVSKILVLTYKDMCSVTVPLDLNDKGQGHQSMLPCVGKVCGDRITGVDCGDVVGSWISEVLQRPGSRLIRQNMTDTRLCKLKEFSDESSSKLSLTNESQYLLICRPSVRELQQRIPNVDTEEIFDLENLIKRFRANLVIGGGQPFAEDKWISISIGNNKFVSQGGCSRCQMVCLDQVTAERSKEPLKTLAAWRGKKIPFGIHLRHDSTTVGSRISVGDVMFDKI